MTPSTPDSRQSEVYSPEGLLKYLRDEQVFFEHIQHPALHTVEEARTFRAASSQGTGDQSDRREAFVKNLFLRDRSGMELLLVAESRRSVNLQRLRAELGLRRLSFASPESLWEALAVKPGSVSPLALINADPARVAFYADESLREVEWIHFHPLSNEHTVTLRVSDWCQLSSHWGFPPNWISLSEHNADL